VPFAETIETATTVLRRPVPDDATPLHDRVTRRPEVARFMTWRPHTDPEETARLLVGIDDEWDRGASATWTIDARPDGGSPTGDVVGPIGMLSAWPGELGVELGFTLAPPWWGRGVMTEVVDTVAHHLLRREGAFRVWATCDVEHDASARVLTKAGFVREGTLRHHALHPNLGPERRDSALFGRTPFDR
jgi:ribosomal-protein-alanine N-acetyltransferase